MIEKTNSRFYTTAKQAEVLLNAFNVDPDTADCYLILVKSGDEVSFEQHIIPDFVDFSELAAEYDAQLIPCWSINALLSVLPQSLIIWDDDAGRNGKNVEFNLRYSPGRISYESLEEDRILLEEVNMEFPINAIISMFTKVKNFLPKED